MTLVDGPRRATPDEFSEMMALVDRCFRKSEGEMVAKLPFCYDEAHPEHHAIIRQDGEIIAHAAAIPQTLIIEGDTISCPGIGGVATDPRYRNNSHMASLLKFWLDQLEAPVIELGGDRQRYGHFGWENAGREYRFELNRRSIPDTATASSVVRYDDDDSQNDLLQQLHAMELFRVERSHKETRQIHSRAGNVTLLCTTDPSAYISFNPRLRNTTVTEFGGASQSIVDLLLSAFSLYALDSITIHIPPEHPILPTVHQVASKWHLDLQRKFNIRDLPTLLSGFRAQMERQFVRSNAEHVDICLGLSDDNQHARIVYDNDVDIQRTTDEPDIKLDRREMTNLLFGMPEIHTEYMNSYPSLKSILPLDYYIWTSERV